MGAEPHQDSGAGRVSGEGGGRGGHGRVAPAEDLLHHTHLEPTQGPLGAGRGRDGGRATGDAGGDGSEGRAADGVGRHPADTQIPPPRLPFSCHPVPGEGEEL